MNKSMIVMMTITMTIKIMITIKKTTKMIKTMTINKMIMIDQGGRRERMSGMIDKASRWSNTLMMALLRRETKNLWRKLASLRERRAIETDKDMKLSTSMVPLIAHQSRTPMRGSTTMIDSLNSTR